MIYHTLAEIKAIGNSVINAQSAAAISETDYMTLLYTAREYPERLGFPVICVGNRVKIPRIPFIKFLAGEDKL